MKTNLRDSVLATISYYDILDYPLTSIEIDKFLINPTRFNNTTLGIDRIDLSQIVEEIKRLEKAEVIESRNDLYFLKGRESLYNVRITKEQIAKIKWRKFLSSVRWLTAAPYLRGVFASGSLALGNTTKESDFDVLIIARSGRLYTCRLFLWLISSVIGKRRKRFEKKAPNKLCFNHYITTNSLRILHESLYNAQTYIHLKPVWLVPGVLNQFYTANKWLNKYVYKFNSSADSSKKMLKRSLLFSGLANLVELILNSTFGDKLESYLERIQQRRIKKNPVTYETGGRVVYNETELEFHPRSFEKFFIGQYNKNLKKLGIVSQVEEKDSGLN